jgi:GT2 family glycosyltransferase
MRASIVIAAHNEGDLLWRTIGSCLETTEGLDCELVAVDDASDDDSIAELQERFGDVQTISVSERAGTSRAKDLAARSSQGDTLVFLDAHCKPERGAIARLIQDVEDWDGDAVIAPRIEPLDALAWETRPVDSVRYGFWLDLEWFHCGWLALDQMRAISGPGGRTFYRQPSLVGCSLAVSRDLYESIHGFDVGMLTWGVEDLDFGLKAWLMGHQVLLDLEPIVGHRFRNETDTPYQVPAEHILLNEIRMARKNFGDGAWNDWFTRFEAHHTPELWRRACGLFDQSREGLERERDVLMARRTRDEFWYASEFDLAWPLTLPGSPYPPPATSVRTRYDEPPELSVTKIPPVTEPRK